MSEEKIVLINKPPMIYTKEFVSKEVNWLKEDIQDMISDWEYAMLDIGRDAPVPVPVKRRLEKFIIKLENLQDLINKIY